MKDLFRTDAGWYITVTEKRRKVRELPLLDAAEAVAEGVVERAGVLVVIVGVSTRQRDGLRHRRGHRQRGEGEEHSEALSERWHGFG